MLNRIRDFHLFKRFKYLLADWWNIDTLIVLKKGDKFYYENTREFKNPVVESLLQSSVFKNYFLSSLNPLISKTSGELGDPKVLPWKQTGLDLFVVPLALQKNQFPDTFKAFLIATGFAPKRKKELNQSLSYLGLSAKAIEQKTELLKELDSTNEIYIQRMLKILAEELFISFKNRQALPDNQSFKEKTTKNYGFMMGESPAMQYIFNVLKKIKNYEACVLIEGDPGTGKRLLAKTIHLESLRSHKAFHIQNFSTFRGSFLESTLFGSHRNSSKALKHKKSLVERLHGGTLLLNEIGHTSLEFQKQLLNFLKSSVFFTEGELKNKKYNVRIMASTSQNLRDLVKKEDFNESLYFAISAMSIKVPPLKYRKMDIPLLVEYFLNKKNPTRKLNFSKPALKLFYNYSWPGNIRELENEIEKMVSLKQKDQVVFTEKDISPGIKNFSSELNGILRNNKNQNLKDTLRSIEKQILLDCLRKNNWNKSKAAQLLGTSRTSLTIKAKEYGLLKEGA